MSVSFLSLPLAFKSCFMSNCWCVWNCCWGQDSVSFVFNCGLESYHWELGHFVCKEWRKLWLISNISALKQILTSPFPNEKIVDTWVVQVLLQKKAKWRIHVAWIWILHGWSLKTSRLSFEKSVTEVCRLGITWADAFPALRDVHLFLLEEFAGVCRCLLTFFSLIFLNYFLLMCHYGFPMLAVSNTGQDKNFIWDTGSRSIVWCWRALCW